MKTSALGFVLLAATACGRVVMRATSGGDARGDARIFAQPLADGIQAKIDQVDDTIRQEQAGPEASGAAKQQLVDFANAGIATRTNSQLISPDLNGVLARLVVVCQSSSIS